MDDKIARTTGSSRAAMVDALRGYALMGLFLVHMEEYFELYWANPKPGPTTPIIFGLFMGKTFSILALCFGFSFFVMMDGGKRRGEPFGGRFAWRLVLLALIGTLHGLIYRGDIIVVLALSGFVLIPLDRIRSSKTLALLAAICFLQPYLLFWIATSYAGLGWAHSTANFFSDPAMQTYLTGSFADVLRANMGPGQANKWWFYIETGRCAQVFGLFLMGLILGRARFFLEPDRYRRQRAWALLTSIVAAMIFYFLRQATAGPQEGPGFWVNTLFSSWFDLACTAMSVLVFIFLWEAGGSRLLRFLVPAGRMTLTLYIAQSLIFVPLFYPFGAGLYAHITETESLLLAVAAFATQVTVASLWFRAFHYGPLEWIWRCGTRMTLSVPFRRRALSPA